MRRDEVRVLHASFAIGVFLLCYVVNMWLIVVGGINVQQEVEADV